jgi:heavy metal translocating P-type ATPase
VNATCLHCKIPMRRVAPEGAAFCCTGCFVAHKVAGADDAGPTDGWLPRLLLSAFLSMGVMCFAQFLYGRAWHDEFLRPSERSTAEALDGVFRLASLVFSLPVLFLIGAPLFDAVVRLRRWFSSDALVLCGVGAAWIVSVWNTLIASGHVYYETATVVLVLVGLGRWLETRARERARGELENLLPAAVQPATLVKDGRDREIAPEELAIGDVVRVRPGETVPIDGTIVAGASFVDASALSGEAAPLSRGEGDRVLAGTVLVDGTLLVRAEAVVGARVRDQIERLLAESFESRPSAVRVADRVSAWLLPCVVAIAVGTALARFQSAGIESALLDALSVLLIACPCALGIATPLAFWIGLGVAWRRGILVRGGEAFERLARARRVFFDKTGTLTEGELALAAIVPRGSLPIADALQIAASLEVGSEHPIARSLRGAARARGSRPASMEVVGFRRLPGVGVRGEIGGESWTLRRPFADDASPTGVPAHLRDLTHVMLVRDDHIEADLWFASLLAEGAREAVRGLRERGLEMRGLTGDTAAPARALSAALDIEVVHDLLPQDKVAALAAAGRARTVFVGDGLNDTAVLAASDVGIAVAKSSPQSLMVAGVQLLRAGVGDLPGLFDLARQVVSIARQNLVWAFAYNAIGVYLAASGRLTPVVAAVAMVVSSAAVVLNSSRLWRGAEAPRADQEPRRTEVADAHSLPAPKVA